MTDAAPLPTLPSRAPSGHKGVFGTVAVVGGTAGSLPPEPGDARRAALAEMRSRARMVGGPALSALAALRAGAGLVRLVMPSQTLDAGLVIAPSATGLAIPSDGSGAIVPHEGARVIDELAEDADALAVGPGLGAGEGPQALALRAAQQERAPVVLDADALNNLAEVPELRLDFRAAAVLTPHPGEFRRLALALGLGAAGQLDQGGALDPAAPASRPNAAEALAQTLGCIVVLKGARAVVSDGHQTWTNEGPGSGADNPSLATAGSGDVLTGALGALVAWLHPRRETRTRALLTELAARALEAKGSRLAGAGAGAGGGGSPPPAGFTLFDCARLAVRAHSLAALLWRERHGGASGGMLAGELADLLPEAMERMRRAPSGNA